MPKSHDYPLTLLWTGAAQGPTTNYRAYSREWTASFDGRPPLVGSADPTFRGDANLYNPEDLLVASLASCHLLSYLALAARAGIEVVAYKDEALGTLSYVNDGFEMTEVLLRPQVTIKDGGDVDKARALHKLAHEQCFIARSVRFEVRHDAVVRSESEARGEREGP